MDKEFSRRFSSTIAVSSWIPIVQYPHSSGQHAKDPFSASTKKFRGEKLTKPRRRLFPVMLLTAAIPLSDAHECPRTCKTEIRPWTVCGHQFTARSGRVTSPAGTSNCKRKHALILLRNYSEVLTFNFN